MYALHSSPGSASWVADAGDHLSHWLLGHRGSALCRLTPSSPRTSTRSTESGRRTLPRRVAGSSVGETFTSVRYAVGVAIAQCSFGRGPGSFCLRAHCVFPPHVADFPVHRPEHLVETFWLLHSAPTGCRTASRGIDARTVSGWVPGAARVRCFRLSPHCVQFVGYDTADGTWR